MSRVWRKHKDEYSERGHTRRYSAAWLASRARRAEKRQGLEAQPRDKQGFILKKNDAGNTVPFDPGPIDRFLWVRSGGTEEAK